jgi:SCP-2 sterol transfer family.
LVIAGVAPIFELRVNRGGGVEVEAEYELAVEGGPRLFASFRQGKLSISTSASGTVDCRLGGDPVTWLLALYGRVPWGELLDTGTITYGGDAELAVKFKSQLRNP